MKRGKEIARQESNVTFRLSGYMIPAVISMVIVGTNANIDGLFIGRIMGDDGLAAINIVWPIVALTAALGTGIGMGGSVLLNDLRGKGENRQAEIIKNTTLLLLPVAGIITSFFLLFLYTPLLKGMGAEGNVLFLSEQYAVMISAGASVQICGAGIVVILRNDRNPVLGMFYSFAGVALHILLDIFLVDPLGMYGVAAATVLSQFAVAAGGFFSVRKERDAKPDRHLISEIIRNSAAPFGINFVPSLVLMFTNYAALHTGGEAGVAAYAVMSYAVYTFDYIFQGVCDGIQPVISYCTGSGDERQKKHAMKTALLILFILSAAFAALTPLWIAVMPVLFHVSDAAGRMMKSGFVIYSASYLLKAVVKYVCSYCYASGRAGISNVLVYLDPLLFTPVSLMAFSSYMGMNGVWIAMPVSQAFLTVAGIAVFAKGRR